MHEVDSWFDLDVRIDESTRRRPSFSGGSLTTANLTIDITIAITIPPRAVAGPSDGVDRPRC
jgi:hypothetical protein